MYASVAGLFLVASPAMAVVACKVIDPFGGNTRENRATAMRKNALEHGKFAPHVLVVDDEPLIRWSITESLSALGFTVEEAADAATALKIVTTSPLPIRIVVLDLRLPDMRDLSLLATLRQLLPDAHLVLMTAFGTPEVVLEAEALGADVLSKPFELDELTRVVLSH